MRIAKNVHKAWSFWASVLITPLLSVLMTLQDHLPILRDVLDTKDYLIVALLVPFLIGVLRAIKQRSVSGD